MKGAIYILVLLSLFQSSKAFSQKYSALQMQDSSFVAFFDEYVQTNQLSDKQRGVPVLFVTRHSMEQVEVVLTMFAVMSEVLENHPDNYTYIHDRLVLIYDGTQQIFSLSPSWLAKLRRLVEPDLCNDVEDELKRKNASRKEEIAVGPCAFKYDPSEWKLTFSKGILVKKEQFFGDLRK